MDSTYYLTDLDGTLLRSDASLSAYTARIITEALERGMVISYATARSYISSNRVAASIPWKYPLVLYNGAMIFDPAAGKVIDGSWLASDLANEIMGLGREHRLLPLLFALDADDRERVMHEPLQRFGDLEFYRSRPNDPRFQEVQRLECPSHYRTLILTYIGLLDELEPLREAIVRQYGSAVHIHLMKDNYIKDHYFLEVSHPDANKGAALRKWAAFVGCKPGQVTVFGDNLNDVPMFREAGTGVAVAGAHGALLELASEAAASNDDDGVARYVEARSLKVMES